MTKNFSEKLSNWLVKSTSPYENVRLNRHAKLHLHDDNEAKLHVIKWRRICSSRILILWKDFLGACWDSAIVERFFGILKNDCIFKVAQFSREHLKQGMTECMRFYNEERFHFSNGSMSPVRIERSPIKVAYLG